MNPLMNWESVYGRPASDYEDYVLTTWREKVPPNRRVHVFPEIPAATLADAKRSFLTDWDEGGSEEWLIALSNPDAHGQGAHIGFALTTRAIYWRNVGQAPGVTSLDALADEAGTPLLPTIRDLAWLDFGAAGRIDLNHFDAATLDSLVAWLHAVASVYKLGVPPEFVRGWYVRHEDDQQRGPYTWLELDGLLRSGALMPYTSHAWGPGFEDWVKMTRIDVVAEILEDLKRAEGAAKPAEPPRSAARRTVHAVNPGEVQVHNLGASSRRNAAPEPDTVGKKVDRLIDTVMKRFKK
jgi:hypothetical protein